VRWRVVLSDAQKALIGASSILIVDDAPANIELAWAVLREFNFNLSSASSGHEALAMARSQPPDLVLLDIAMPEMDGYETCRELKADPSTSHIPVIFLTALSDSSDIVRGFDAGGVDYITKPFNRAELVARLLTHLELSRSRIELKTLNEDKDRFIDLISHDLKSPVGGQMNLMEILHEKFDTLDRETLKQYVGLLRESAKTQYRFLENLLQWGRLQMGRVQFSPSLHQVKDDVNFVLNLLSLVSRQKEISIANSVDPGCAALYDRPMIQTVLNNLVSNALKFTRRGGSIALSAADEGSMIRISVTDTGVGISPGAVKKLFQIATIFSTPGTEKEPGTGLGLILCRGLVGKNGGEIGVESEKGKGSTFFFTLPKETR